MADRRVRGTSLIEILIASVLLAVAGVAVMSIYRAGTKGIQVSDLRREERFYLQEILAHVNRNSLHQLWDHYGPQGFGPPRPLLGALALVDGNGKMADPENLQANPLGFTQDLLDEMRRDGIQARIDFDFYSRNELQVKEDGAPNQFIGLLHMQAGYVAISLFNRDPGEDPGAPPPDPTQVAPVAVWRQPIMCPAIVGRPGLKLSSCPALSPRVKCKYGPELARKEGYTWTPEDEKACEEYKNDPDAS